MSFHAPDLSNWENLQGYFSEFPLLEWQLRALSLPFIFEDSYLSTVSQQAVLMNSAINLSIIKTINCKN